MFSWFRRNMQLAYMWYESKTRKSIAKSTVVSLYLKILYYIESPEFLEGKYLLMLTYFFETALSIPDDFQIKYSIFNLHIWLIINKLNKINVIICFCVVKSLFNFMNI